MLEPALAFLGVALLLAFQRRFELLEKQLDLPIIARDGNQMPLFHHQIGRYLAIPGGLRAKPAAR
jgi:hypothetical protein